MDIYLAEPVGPFPIDTTIERAIGVSAAFSASNAANQVQVDDLRVLLLN